MALSTTVGVEFIARNRSAAGISAFNSSLGTTTMYLRRLMTAALAVGGVYGIGYMIKTEIEAMHTTINLADRLGMSTEALTTLQHAAKMTGVEQEQLTTSLDFFNRTLGDAQKGLPSAQKAFTDWGISLKGMAGLNLDEKIGIVADQINKLGSESQKAAARQDLFGKGSQTLAGLFAEGSKGIAAYRQETEKFGLILKAIDASQVEAAEKALTRLNELFGGIRRQIVIELAPYIEAAASAFVNWATAGEGVGANVSRAFEIASLSVVEFANQLEAIPARYNEIMASMMRFNAMMEKTAIGRAGALGRRIVGGEDPAKLAAEYEAKAAEARARAQANLTGVEQFYADLRAKAQERAAALPREGALDISPSALEKIAAMKRYIAQTNAPAMSAEEMRAVVERTREAIDSIRHMDDLTRQERIANLKAYASANAEELGKVAEANRALNDEILAIERSRVDAMKVYQAELREDMQNINLYISERFADTARNIEGSLSNAFNSMIADGASWRDAMSQFFIDVGNAFSRMAADMVAREAAARIIQPLMGGLMDIVGGGAGTDIGGGYAAKLNADLIMAGEAHTGGRVGALNARRWVDTSLFENAPRFHDLRPGETAVIAQDDEVISRPGRSRAGQPPSVVINNYTGQKFESQGPSFDGERWVVGIVAQNIKQGGGLKKMIRR